MSQRFTINFKNSSDSYLHSTYSTKDIIAGVSDTGELDRYLETIKDTISRCEGSIFWDWDAGSYPFYGVGRQSLSWTCGMASHYL